MTPFADSVDASGRGNVLAPTASSLRMRALDRAASPATAPPRVADPPQAVTHESAVGFTESDRPNRDVVPRAVVRHEGIQSYVWCDCGYTTGYTDSDAQAERIALEHAREAHDA